MGVDEQHSRTVDRTENTKRLAKNTFMLYIRMFFSMAISLYTSRVILQALGVEDYGISSVVGGFVSMFALISSALSSATSRFLTFELGKNDRARTKKVFVTSLLIHSCLALIILIAFESFGVWFLNTKMNIAESRMFAANCVFQTSIIGFLLGIFTVPFTSAVVAHERMDTFAFVGIFEAVARLFIVMFIANAHFNFDKLVLFSILQLCLSVAVQTYYIVFCRWNFHECSFRLKFHKDLFKEMCSFAGWTFIGCSAAIFKGQGVNMLLNIFRGTVVNAAYGLAMSVNHAVSGFANNFMTALNPQITKTYASGEREYMYSLMNRGTRFSYYILFIITLPLVLETHFVLSLWLHEFPGEATNFVRLCLILSMFDMCSNTLITAQNATGRIRLYQVIVGGLLMLNFPLSYLCLKLGLPSFSVFIVAIVISIVGFFIRLLFVNKSTGLPLKQFLLDVSFNIATVTIFAVIIPLVVRLLMEPGWERFVTVVSISVICAAISIVFWGCSKSEREFLFKRIRNIRKRLTR